MNETDKKFVKATIWLFVVGLPYVAAGAWVFNHVNKCV